MKRSLHACVIVFISVFLSSAGCEKKNSNPAPLPPSGGEIRYWITTGDRTSLLQESTAPLSLGTVANSHVFIDVDTTQAFQNIEGFGYTLTSGSASVINGLSAAVRSALLRELFTNDPGALAISYLRISIGASDLSASVYSYDDLPAGQTDISLNNFSLAPDMTDVIPLLKEIVQLQPAIKILATPWSPPVWMKDNGSSVGGSLRPEYYSVYANYLVRYIQEMKNQGITIDALTPQNEPLHPGNNPSMYMTGAQQAEFIKNHLGPALQSAGLSTRIIIYDHNADRPDYPIGILNDAAARPFVHGSAFHLYAGDVSALSQVHNAFPDKHIYFTEQYTASNGEFGGDLKWHLKNVIIGSLRNWSRTALEWNLANDPSYGPHTPGGCTTCKGALTIGNNTVNRNVAYYIIGHVSRFVPPGSVRIGSNTFGSLQNVAFKTPAGKKVLVVENDGTSALTFNIRFAGQWATASLPGGAVGTYVW